MFAKWNSSRSNEEGSCHAVIKDTGRETKEKTVEWISEALHAAQEADSEIKPILEWKETFQEPPEKEVVMVLGFATSSDVQQWDRLHLKGRCLMPTLGE